MAQQTQTSRTQRGPSQVVGTSKPRLLDMLGPGLISGAADDDPTAIATYAQAGAAYGYGLCWLMPLCYPLMAVVQEVSARIGRTTGRGLAGNIARHYPGWLPTAASRCCSSPTRSRSRPTSAPWRMRCGSWSGGRSSSTWCCSAPSASRRRSSCDYARYVAILKWTTLSLLAYVAAAPDGGVPWREVGAARSAAADRARRATTCRRSSPSSAWRSAPTSSSGRPRRRPRTSG